MKQFQLKYEDDAAFLEKLSEINDWAANNPSYVKIFRIYSSDMDEGHVSHVCGLIEQAMPDALYFGCTTNANIEYGVLAASQIIMTCTIFEYETTKARMLQFPFDEGSVREVVDALKRHCEENPWVTSIEMVATIVGMSMKEFCDEMTGLRSGIQVFGGGAFNPDMDDDKAFVFSKGNGQLANGIVFLTLGGEDLHIYSTFISGWKPLKRRFRITKADKEILYELDGKPAFDVYRRFLNINKNDKFFSNTLEFPLFMEHGDIDILRCPLSVNDDDSLVMSSDMDENGIVRLAYGDPETILNSIGKDGQKIADFQPEVIQTFSCAARKAFWGDENISDETALFNKVAPTAGFYTHGEFIRINGDMLNFNVTLVIAAMREGEPVDSKKVNIYTVPMENADKVPIIWRFVSFIEASTTELEEANKRLAQTSITDGLTGLYNRAEIEHRIRHRIEPDDAEAEKGLEHESVSLIMLDIDNFKKVNDIYGHQEGDCVITSLANVLRSVAGHMAHVSMGRWGGEEFMVLLDGNKMSEAMEIAEKIRSEFARISYETAGCQTVSIGVTQARCDENADALYNRVDKALYMAKAAGKNQVVSL